MTKHQLCRNCGQIVEGIFCSNCGQRNDVARLSWKSLAESFISTFVGDGAIEEKRNNVRYGLLLTLWSLIIHPGKTVDEYLDGRRRKYFNPVTILLLLSGFYALLSVFTGVVNDIPKASDITIIHYLNLLVAYCSSHPAIWYLLLLPFTAISYKWIFRKKSDLRYVEYIHVGIFVAIFSILLLLVRLPFEWWLPDGHTADRYVLIACMAAQCWFSVTIYRTLFHIRFKQAVWNWIGVMTLSSVLCFFSIVLLVALLLWCYYAFAPESFTGMLNYLSSGDKTGALRDALQETDSLRVK